MEPSVFVSRADLGFAWSVKDSFLRYIRGMRDGDISWDGGAAVTSNGEFFFPLADARRIEDRTVLSFRGTVTFTAHHGLLSVRIAHPRICLGESRADLSIVVGGTERKIATVDLPPLMKDGDVTMWLNCAVRLRGEGTEHFGGTYIDGEQLAPLTIRIPTRAAALATDHEKVRAR